jgi:hypothetical protein
MHYFPCFKQNYYQTLSISTRFLQARAKTVKNKPTINEAPSNLPQPIKNFYDEETDKLIP